MSVARFIKLTVYGSPHYREFEVVMDKPWGDGLRRLLVMDLSSDEEIPLIIDSRDRKHIYTQEVER